MRRQSTVRILGLALLGLCAAVAPACALGDDPETTGAVGRGGAAEMPTRGPDKTPSEPTVAVAVDLRVDGARTRLTLTLSRPVQASAFVLERPDRAIVDLPEVTFQVPPDSVPRRTGLVTAIRFGLVAPGRSRIVADLGQPAIASRVESVAGADGAARLVIEFTRADRETFRRRAQAGERGGVTPNDAVRTTGALGASDAPAKERPVIVVDAGHGGADPGARAVSGEVEKDIVLAFAERLRDTLTEGGRYRVAMTRDRDVFVPLDERVRRARAAGADLMISIHADSISSPTIAGATVYTSAERPTDVESANLAQRENESDAMGGFASGDAPGGVTEILQDLMARETRGFSHRFAAHLLGQLKPVIRFSPQPHREAGFRVLRSADVPAVLVELGYLSNQQDTAHLLSEDWRRATATAMAGAVARYFATMAASRTAAVSP